MADQCPLLGEKALLSNRLDVAFFASVATATGLGVFGVSTSEPIFVLLGISFLTSIHVASPKSWWRSLFFFVSLILCCLPIAAIAAADSMLRSEIPFDAISIADCCPVIVAVLVTSVTNIGTKLFLGLYVFGSSAESMGRLLNDSLL